MLISMAKQEIYCIINSERGDVVTNVLFICTGNTCRSPMAEALLKHKGEGRFNVKSAGVTANMGSRANANAIKVLDKRGISLVHRSQIVTKELNQWADTILSMTEDHKFLLLQQFPQVVDKVFTLKEYVLNSEENTRVWKEVQQSTANLEEIRARYLYHLNNSRTSNVNLKNEEKRLIEAEKKNNALIYELEMNSPGLNISDPFGGTEAEYEQVCKELESLIDQLIEKRNH